MTLTRRDLLARAGRLAPLAAAAGMLGKVAGPEAAPAERAVTVEWEPTHEALAAWIPDGPDLIHLR